ncbi:MAG: hypothetical protein CM1200mP3_18810 [Chloroflexota bacterium]|nr:MAG: hypothetical protein CM1200mP3_18810 [Chloroflexota bacterium]
MPNKKKNISSDSRWSASSYFCLNGTKCRMGPSDVFLKSEDNGNGYTLNGTKLFVPNANVSDFIIVVARTGKRGEGY